MESLWKKQKSVKIIGWKKWIRIVYSTDLQNPLDSLKSRMDIAEEKINELEHLSTVTT